MDEYTLEINDLRRRIAKLKFERASTTIIEELEAQLRILKAIYDSASSLYVTGEKDRQVQAAFADQQFGDWTFDNVYFYVYEQAVAIEPEGHDLATLIWHHDYTAPLLSSVAAQ
jgi:DNA mismatch repair ATPase MutS